MRRVCVVVVHHRGKELLAACLRSVLASREVHVDVVVLCNACDEDLPSIVHESGSIRCIHSSRPIGFSAANNMAVAAVQGQIEPPDFYLFLNNDTCIEPEALAVMVEAAGSGSRTGVVGPRLMIWGASKVINSLGLNVTLTGEAWDEGIGVPLSQYGPLPGAAEVLSVTGAALMIRADLLATLGGWGELYEYYFEDIDLCLRARELGFRVIVEPTAVVYHAISATATRGSDFKLRMSWRNRLILVAIHWPFALLARAVPRLLWRESRILVARLLHQALHDARLQVRSWLEFLRVVPQVLRLRRSRGKRAEWTVFLRPDGSVPTITLPEVEDLSGAIDRMAAASHE